MGACLSIDSNDVYWTQHDVVKDYNEPAKRRLRAIVKEFMDVYVEIDEKSHIMCDEFNAAFYVYVQTDLKSRGSDLVVTYPALNHCVRHWLGEFAPGVVCRGLFATPDRFLGAYVGMRLKAFPSGAPPHDPARSSSVVDALGAFAPTAALDLPRAPML